MLSGLFSRYVCGRQKENLMPVSMLIEIEADCMPFLHLLGKGPLLILFLQIFVQGFDVFISITYYLSLQLKGGMLTERHLMSS